MKVEFDAGKDAANRSKHGVSLTFGARVLSDLHRIEVLDVRVDYGEDRFVVYGQVRGRVWVCVHAPRDAFTRIISVRKANDRETERYERSPR